MYTKILPHVRDHVQQFYGNCQTLRMPELRLWTQKKLWENLLGRLIETQ